MAAVAIYAASATAYLRWVELPRRRDNRPRRSDDVFDLLTYRERYEDLLARSGRDALTGALDRGRLEHLGRKHVEEAAMAGRPLSLLISTSTTSRASTTVSAMPPATWCCCASRAS